MDGNDLLLDGFESEVLSRPPSLEHHHHLDPSSTSMPHLERLSKPLHAPLQVQSIQSHPSTNSSTRLTFEFLISSMALLSYGANPATSLMTDWTVAAR